MIFNGSTPDGLPSTPAQPEIAPGPNPLLKYLSFPQNPTIDRFRCCLGHQLSISSVALTARSGPTSLRTAAAMSQLIWRRNKERKLNEIEAVSLTVPLVNSKG
jgi:hypothetical protein